MGRDTARQPCGGPRRAGGPIGRRSREVWRRGGGYTQTNQERKKDRKKTNQQTNKLTHARIHTKEGMGKFRTIYVTYLCVTNSHTSAPAHNCSSAQPENMGVNFKGLFGGHQNSVGVHVHPPLCISGSLIKCMAKWDSAKPELETATKGKPLPFWQVLIASFLQSSTFCLPQDRQKTIAPQGLSLTW